MTEGCFWCHSADGGYMKNFLKKQIAFTRGNSAMFLLFFFVCSAYATSVTLPFSFSAGSPISASQMMGNFSSITSAISNTVSSPWVTSSSNIYYNAGSVGIGSSAPAHALDVSGTISAASGFRTPFFEAIITSAQTIPGAWTVLHFNSVIRDTLGAYDPATYQYKPTIAGYYYCTAMVTVATANSLYYAAIFKTGNETAGLGIYPGIGGGSLATSVQIAGILYLDGVNDFIDFRAGTNGSVNVYNPGPYTYANRFSAFLLYAGS